MFGKLKTISNEKARRRCVRIIHQAKLAMNELNFFFFSKCNYQPDLSYYSRHGPPLVR